MEDSTPRTRPRAPRVAACFACRQRKSRCKLERGASVCLMCRSHDTKCAFPPLKTKVRTRGIVQLQPGQKQTSASEEQACASVQPETSQAEPALSAIGGRFPHDVNGSGQLPKTLDSLEDENSNQRLVGPALESDSQALSSILASNLHGRHVMRTVWTSNPSGWSAPIVFTRSRKRPVGLQSGLNPAQAKLQLIEKFLEPWLSRLIEL